MNSRRRGLISLVLMCVLALGLILGSERIYKSLKALTEPKGTVHETSAEGFGGSVVVQTVIDAGVITAVEVLDCSTETEEFGQAAAPEVAQAIVDAQSTDVDGVSGATLTSNAIKAAVEEALAEEAGTKEVEAEEAETEEAETEEAEATETEEADS